MYLVAGTRPDELTLATARNDAEKDYQSSVSDARETLLHDRAVAEIGKAHDKTETDITAAQTKFNAREATKAPDSLESSPGFEEGFPSRPRPKVTYADPSNTGMPYTPPNYADPPGFGLYRRRRGEAVGRLDQPTQQHDGNAATSRPDVHSVVRSGLRAGMTCSAGQYDFEHSGSRSDPPRLPLAQRDRPQPRQLRLKPQIGIDTEKLSRSEARRHPQ